MHKDEIVAPTRSQDVTNRLRDLVMRGEIGAGEKLREVALAAILGVSRTPLRTALTSLHQEGLLDYAPKRGYSVRRFTIVQVLDAYRIRAVLEGLACRQAAEAGLPTPLRAKLERGLEHYGQIAARGVMTDLDRFAVIELNQAFHSTLLEAAGSPMLSELIAQTQKVPLASLRMIPNAGRLDRSHADHIAILDAVVRRDPEGAERAMRAHVDFAAALVEQLHAESLAGEPGSPWIQIAEIPPRRTVSRRSRVYIGRAS